MAPSILSYISALFILFIIFFIYCHLSRLKTINNELKILQVSDPDYNIAYELFEKHQPIIFQKEIFFWKEINTLIGMPLSNIKNEIATHTNINYSDYIKNNLENYNLPLSYDWNIDIRNVVLDDKSSIFFIKQTNYMQLFGCMSGEIRVIITPSDQSKHLEPFVNMVSTVDATPILNRDPIELNYIEIIIRQGNMIYIPWNWFYFIYKGHHPTEECVIIDCANKSILSLA